LDVVGCGAAVEGIHVPLLELLRSRSEVEVVGCYDRNLERARRIAAALGARRWGPEASPLEGDGVDGALIATPPAAHAELAHRYIQARKSVLVEKPFTVTAEEARSLVSDAAARGVAIAVDHSWRFHPSVNVARRFLAGRSDQIASVEAAEGYRWTWSSASDYAFEDPYGGVIHDTGSHLMDMVLYVLGLDTPEAGLSVRVESVRKVPAGEPSHECAARLTLSAAAGEPLDVRMTISRLRPLPRGVKVRGSFGLLFIPTTFALAPVLFDGGRGFRLRSAEPQPEAEDEFGCILRVHLDFLRAARGDRGSRTDAARFVMLSEVLESLHRGAPA
jgi:predicted dehydrogenase